MRGSHVLLVQVARQVKKRFIKSADFDVCGASCKIGFRIARFEANGSFRIRQRVVEFPQFEEHQSALLVCRAIFRLFGNQFVKAFHRLVPRRRLNVLRGQVKQFGRFSLIIIKPSFIVESGFIIRFFRKAVVPWIDFFGQFRLRSRKLRICDLQKLDAPCSSSCPPSTTFASELR